MLNPSCYETYEVWRKSDCLPLVDWRTHSPVCGNMNPGSRPGADMELRLPVVG